jgi:hypothetical protein
VSGINERNEAGEDKMEQVLLAIAILTSEGFEERKRKVTMRKS